MAELSPGFLRPLKWFKMLSECEVKSPLLSQLPPGSRSAGPQIRAESATGAVALEGKWGGEKPETGSRSHRALSTRKRVQPVVSEIAPGRPSKVHSSRLSLSRRSDHGRHTAA